MQFPPCWNFCVLYSLLALLHIRYDEYVANMKLYLASAAITYSLKFLLSSGIKKDSQADGGKFRQHQMGTPDNWIFTYFSGWYINLLLFIHERQNSSRICTFFKWNSAGNQCRDSDFDRFDRKKTTSRRSSKKTLNEQLRSQRANIDALSSAYATQRKMTHDFRHHIAALSGMLQGGETQQAQDYLAALQEQQTERA